MTKIKYSMVKYIIIIIFLFTQFSLSASSYPNVNESVPLDLNNQSLLNKEVLQEFISSWEAEYNVNLESIETSVKSGSLALKSLESVATIQEIQLNKLKKEALPKFSLVNTPQTPLYSFMDNTSSVTTPPPTTITITSHSFGISGGIKQQLPTAGTIDLTLSNSATYSKESITNTYGWKQNPSASLNLSQPLFINNKVLDFSYASTILDRQTEKKISADNLLESTSKDLVLSSLSLLHTYQGLKESRWLLMRDVILREAELERAKDDLSIGLLSENQLLIQQNAFQGQLVQLSELENQISSIANSLIDFGLEEVGDNFLLPKISYNDIAFITMYSGSKIVDSEEILQKALESDGDYQTALSNLRDAQFQLDLGNPADAPIINVSLNYSPYVTSTSGATFTDSFSDLFSSSTENNISVSVSLIASDLSRNLSKSTEALAKEQLLQAQISLQESRRSVEEKLRNLQSSINTTLEQIKINTTRYHLAVEQVEIEKINSSVGLSSDEDIEVSEIGRYREAFTLLSTIRKAYELSVTLKSIIN